jgi:aspartyl-tRNA(Asn)/glutamyl-tRNA(Gln) amidotransferase subunit B
MTYIISGKNNQYEIVIGCEIHAQISSKSKLFSRSATDFGALQNSQVSFIDAAMPGMLPLLNEFCIKQAIKTGLALNAQINLVSYFDRKNYFYPDLPQGYQISQFIDPIVKKGYIEIINEDGFLKKINITRLHLEQDAGKSIHDQDPLYSLIDLNRAGVGLMEIVSNPDLSSPFEAAEYVKKIRSIVRSIETCDGDMEKGNLRCDANVSVRKVGSKELGTRCEIKNLNSIRNISRAIEFEAKRQVDLLEENQIVIQQTRLFDALNGETRTLRSKEDAMDYRYFNDPDLLPLVLTLEFIEEIRKELPELPEAKKARYIQDYKLSDYDAGVLTSETEISEYFEKLVVIHDPKLVVTWLTVELFGRMNKSGINFSELKIAASDLIELLNFIKDGTISGKIAKDVLDIMIEEGEKAEAIILKKGLKQVSDSGAIEVIIEKVLQDNQSSVLEYKAGKEKLFGFFIGQIMKESKGQVNPQLANDILKKKLSDFK